MLDRTLALVFATTMFLFAAEPAAQTNPQSQISPELRAHYWRAAAEVQNADAQAKSAHESFIAALGDLRTSCEKESKELSQDQKGEPVCVAKKVEVKEKR